MTEDQTNLPRDFTEAARFHGHTCPGLALGVRVARAALAHFSAVRAPDEELVAVVENDTCAVDALQALLGTTLGKGNLLFRDHGKHVFTIFHRRSGEGLRLVARPKGSVRSAEVVGESDERRRDRRIGEVLDAPLDALLELGPSSEEMPPRAPRLPSERCEECGEEVMVTRLEERSGRKLCLPCAR